MPGLKLFLRRTLSSTTVSPTSILSPPPATAKHRPQLLLCRSTLARGGARLRISGAHVKALTTTKDIKGVVNLMMGKNNNNKKNTLYVPCCATYSSSSSHSPSKFEERENRAKAKAKAKARASLSSSSEQSEDQEGSNILVADTDMGHDSHKGNDVVDWHQNGIVSPSDNNNKNQQPPESSKLLTLPTILTLARVAAIPIFIATYYVNNWWGTAATTSIFVAAAITDWLDGYLARRMGLGTVFGAFLDPVADKLMVAATLVLLCSRPPETGIFGDAPWLFPVPAIAIIGREITMSAVREWAASQNTKLLQAVAVNNLGKWKTATQMTALMILLATRDSSLAGSGALVTSGVGLLYISAGLAVWSLVVYMRKIWKVLLK